MRAMVIPQSPEIERAVIGQLLLEPDLLRKAGLRAEDFRNRTLQRIFRAMAGLFQKKQTFDLPLLAGYLGQTDFEILNKISSESFTTINFPSHASQLRELSAKRKLQVLFAEAAEDLSKRESKEIYLKVRQGSSEIMAGQGAESITGAEMAAHGWKWIQERAERKGNLAGIPCGLKPLDEHLDGFWETELYLIAARPSVGKSAFAQHCLLSAARAGFPGAFLSLEMGQIQIEHRILSNLSGIPLWKIRKGLLKQEEWDKIGLAANALCCLPIRFSFGARNLKDVISTAINFVENHEVKILFLDYLQLVSADGAQNREREVSMISGEMKGLAASLKVPVIALSQLSRAPEKREDRRPSLADLRDSGSLEQDADNVILLYRESISEPRGEVEFIIAKGRNCGTGTIKAFFDGETQRFRESENDQ